MRRTIRTVLGIAAACGAASAWADVQLEPRLRVAEAAESSTPSPAGTPTQKRRVTSQPSGETTSLEEVIVTAQKRSERIENVPILISVLGGADLDQSTAEGVTESLNRVPGVTSTTALIGGGSWLTVRGVSAAGSLFFGGNPIAYYLDSIPFGFVKSAIAPDSNAYDLDRVEVLRGPQGTLYGASALNGVVRVLTKDADLDKFEFKARTSAASIHDGGENYRGDAAMNVPLIDGKLAVRAVVGYQNLDGWLDKPNAENFNDAEIRNYRLKVNARPTDALELGLSAWVSRADIGGPSQSGENRFNSVPVPEPMTIDYEAYNFNVGYDFGGVRVTSATSYLDYDSTNDLDLRPLFGGAPIDLMLFTGLESNVFTEELVANSQSDGNWRWSLGAIYRDAEDRTFQNRRFLGNPPFGDYELIDHSKSYAVFGEATRRLSDGRFEITGGLRYFKDDLHSHEGNVGEPPRLDVNPSFDAVTPRAVLTWHPRDRSTVYASYAEGFRSGFDQFYDAKTQLNLPPVKPDKLHNYELGAKGSSEGGLFRYEAAVYYIKWDDVQQSLSVIVDGIPAAANTNGDSASGIGVDLSASVSPLDGLELGASLAWNDLTVDKDVVSAGVVLFEAGDRLANSPEYSASIFSGYSFPMGGGGLEGRLSVSANYVSEQSYVTLLAGRYATEGDDMLIARAEFGVASSNRWTTTLFVDNFLDEDGAPLVGLVGVPDWSLRVRPRTVGLQLEYKF